MTNKTNGENDKKWSDDLLVDADRLVEYLGDGPLFASIKKCGELYALAKHILDDTGAERLVMDVMAAQQFNKTLREFGCMPEIRFYNCSYLFVEHRQVVFEVTDLCIPPGSTGHATTMADAEYDAVLTRAVSLSVMWIANKNNDEMLDCIVKYLQSCINCRPRNSAPLLVVLGNLMMVSGQFTKALDYLKKALALDEEKCYGASYTIGNIHQSLTTSQSKKEKAHENLYSMCLAFKQFLKLAPKGHWHVHRAAICLCGRLFQLKTCGKEHIKVVANRNPGLCKEVNEYYKLAVEATELYENCYGRESSDFKFQYKQASGFISRLHDLNLLPKEQKVASTYLCGNPSCTASHYFEIGKLSKCSRCLTVRYCSKDCQTNHWKAYHKKECKRLAKEREDRLKANPSKMRRAAVTERRDS